LTPPSQTGGSWTQTTLYSFQGSPDGLQPLAGVLPGANGALLGTTVEGGPVNVHCHYGCGTLFQLTPPSQAGGAWTEEIFYDFAKQDYGPGMLVASGNGSYFGPASFGGSKSCDPGCGWIYELLPPTGSSGDWSLTQIHGFMPDTGKYPTSNAPLVVGPGGVLYGTAEGGGNESRSCGSLGCGTAFSLTPPVSPSTAWTFQDIYRFHGGSDGADPEGLITGTDGTLYGTTYFGGGTGCTSEIGCGTVFSLSPPSSPGGPWVETILYSFQGGNDGLYPMSDLVLAPSGILYGATEQGGGTGCLGQGCGTLFQLMPPAVVGGSWTEAILHTFTGGADGQYPPGAPALDASGVLYGFAQGGTGTSCSGGGCGVVYQYVP
jgi:hypothetical protein